jgi:predicted nuclease with TOPRIM domain
MTSKGPEIVDLTIVVLREIRDQVTGLRGDIHELRDGQRTTNDRLERLEAGQAQTNDRLERMEVALVQTNRALGTLEKETMDGFTGVRRELDKLSTKVDATNTRLDGLRDSFISGGAGEANRDTRQRVDRLEARMDRLEGSGRGS